jgi:RNA polymerase-interacting CarD/CdnL/TRCF family regulator
MDSSRAYSKEDWLVHAHYGTGQIKDIEVKRISGENVRYFRIQANDCTYWMPVTKMDRLIIRPISSLEEIRLVVVILQRPPKEMSPDHNMRKNRIRSVQLQNVPEDIARLVRDLQARRRDKGKYNTDEYKIIRTLKQRLVDEWSIVTGENENKVKSNLDALINRQHLPEDII